MRMQQQVVYSKTNRTVSSRQQAWRTLSNLGLSTSDMLHTLHATNMQYTVYVHNMCNGEQYIHSICNMHYTCKACIPAAPAAVSACPEPQLAAAESHAAAVTKQKTCRCPESPSPLMSPQVHWQIAAGQTLPAGHARYCSDKKTLFQLSRVTALVVFMSGFPKRS